MSNHRAAYLILICSLTACDEPGSGPADAPGADAPADAVVDAAAPLDASTGQIWIRGTELRGATNRIVLASVTPSGGGPPSGAICVPVTSDPFAFVAAARTPGAGNPCSLGAVVTYPDGTYAISAGLYTPGMQTPDLCATATVTVTGAGDVTLPPFAACP